MRNRLSKVLAAGGIASRRASEQLIFDGLVKVNGKTALKPQDFVDTKRDTIAVRGQKVSVSEEKKYFIMNKPKGYMCSHKVGGSKKRIYDLVEHLPYRLFSVGRLDRDTTGLILLTNDGHFANSVIHPSANISKEYLVKVHQEVSDEHLKSINQGTRIEGCFIRPFSVRKLRKGTLKIVVKEGKKREVRLLVENAGMTIHSLQRIRLGGLTLGTLPAGAVRELSENEKSALFA